MANISLRKDESSPQLRKTFYLFLYKRYDDIWALEDGLNVNGEGFATNQSGIHSPQVRCSILGQGRLTLSSLQWVDKRVPSLLGNLKLRVSRQTDHLTGTSAHTHQGSRSRILS
ncbi:hypothetical protein TNCV_835251 [Trichonephila clavipes]|nr:hypothetical protein TNCV_835251 [Trichonephila clavipes]